MIKITPADKWFSLCVRIRSNWTCEYKGTYFPDPSSRNGLHCSHFHGRGLWETRFDPFNAFAHSYGSHQYLGASHNRRVFEEWVEKTIGGEQYAILQAKHGDSRLAREYRKANKLKEGRTTALAAHFKREYERMEQMRMDGDMGRIEFKPFL